jgi:flagellar biosynthesis/type III secretory pathway protein FliH
VTPADPAAALDAVRARAHAEGFETGMEEGRATAHAQWSGRLAAATAALEQAARTFAAARAELAAEVERQMPRVLHELTRKVLHQELAHAETAAQAAILGLAERLRGCDRPVVVRLAPQTVEAFDAWRRSDDGAPVAGTGVRVEADAELGAADWVLQTGDGFLDGRVQSQLDEAWRLMTEADR